MKKYTVSIYETLVCKVEVEADSEEEAEEIAAENWDAGEYLYINQFSDGVDFSASEINNENE